VTEPVKRLYRSRRQRIIAGVCGGIAEYFNLDPVIVRILWIIFTLAGGGGLLTYIAALFIMENNPSEAPPKQKPRHPSSQRAFWGTVLIVVGLVLMFSTFRWFYFPFFYIRWEIVFASILIAVGVAIVLYGIAGARAPAEPAAETETEKAKGEQPPETAAKRLYRSRDSRIIFGICGGLGNYFNLDPVLVRIVWLLLSFFSGGAGFLVYLVLVFIIPEQPQSLRSSIDPRPNREPESP
jgi:phage shock protein C